MVDSGSTMRSFAILGVSIVGLLLCSVWGCGGDKGDDEVVINESPLPDFTPAPGESVITVAKSPRPAQTPAPAPQATPAPTGSIRPATGSDGQVPFLVVLPALAADKSEFQPRVRVQLTATLGGQPVSIADETSGDGPGMAGLFKAVKRGRYLMRVTASGLPDYPLLQRPVDVNGTDPAHLQFGAVTVRIPTQRSFDVSGGIEIAFTEEPSKKPVFKGLLSKVQTQGVLGESHPLMLPLPFGRYSYALADLSKDPTLGFVNVPKNAPLVLSENMFELTGDKPVAILSLESLIRVR